ncbi:VWA domain-containing protein [Crateriforma conspicua]|uniref:VWA domain-containing protein n=1 Tax=Crateriforma TaxID=2714592 RepID=UPI0018CDCE5C|nr:vWA domain-containing protein [Crateriforma conspicua]
MAFVLDCSGSMDQEFALVTDALLDAVEALKPTQEFAVIFFNDLPTQVIPNQPVAATGRNKQRLKKAMRSVQPSGGTEPTPAMTLAINMETELIIVMSDGEFDLSDVSTATMQNHQRSAPATIDSIGLNGKPQTLVELSRLNGPGIFTSVTSE